MKNKKTEANVILGINALKIIMIIFTGPFLTAYFIKKSAESINDLSIYYIFSYIILAIGSFAVASIVKNKFRIGMFRVGVIINFFYIIVIIVLKEKIIDNLWLISILYGLSASAYFFPYNLFVINKIENSERTRFTVKSIIVESLVEVLCPILLGSIITVTNYELTAIIILVISFIQIILSFKLTPERENELPRFNAKDTWNRLKKNQQIQKMSIVEFFVGMNASDGALKILITILIFNSFKTDMNLGVITSIISILAIIVLQIYEKVYKNRNDSKLLTISSILPVISVLVLLVWRNNLTVIIYNIIFVIFTKILSVARQVRLYNLADSEIVDKNSQCEFFAIREVILNLGRITGYTLLLFAGLTGNEIVLNIVMVILTLSILVMGLNVRKISKFEE